MLLGFSCVGKRPRKKNHGRKALLFFSVLDLRVAKMLSHIGEVDTEQVVLPVVVAQKECADYSQL